MLPPERRLLFLLTVSGYAFAQSQPVVFRAESNLQSIAVQVTDKQGRDIHGLTAADFTLLEDGRPQKIAFFGAEHQPISLVVLLDSSTSMESSRKLAGARALTSPLLRGNLLEDEIYLVPFTDRVGKFQPLPASQRQSPPLVGLASMGGGTALYDALATALCQLRSAGNVRQAVVVITDGADQHSRLEINQLIHLAQFSKPQIFMIGFFEPRDYETFKQSGPTVTLVTGHDIDNPLHVFSRIAKETGAESFFPSSERDLQQVITHVLGILEGQYTLAYYPKDIGTLRRIQVKVNRPGVNVASRHMAGAQADGDRPVHFSAASCEVSPIEHPYPWEPHVTEGAGHTRIYQEDFSDAHSGWPVHNSTHYGPRGYEIIEQVPAPKMVNAGPSGAAEGDLVAYGPWWENFRASISVEASDGGASGMVFRLNDEGCYELLLSGSGKARGLSYKLVKRTFGGREQTILPWTVVPPDSVRAVRVDSRITVECRKDQIALLLNGVELEKVTDTSFDSGYIGVARYGYGRTLFRDLRVESLP